MIKERFVHLIYIPFSGVGVADMNRKPNWLFDRMDAFFEYTLNSLTNQTNKTFTLWMSFAPGDKYSKEVELIQSVLKYRGINYIMTFDGLMYWDDKFSHKPMEIVKNAARVIRQAHRTKQWHNIHKTLAGLLVNKNDTLLDRLTKSLDLIKVYLHDVDWVYLTRLDSDDMLRSNVVADIQASPRDTKRAYTMDRGYMYNARTKELAHYAPKTNPPFHTIVFPGAAFFNPVKHIQYYGTFKSHEDIPRVFSAVRLVGQNYCVVIHSAANQISTIWDHPYRGEIIDDPQESFKILQSFGQP